MVVGVGVEEYFLQQIVVFAEDAACDAHVALEGRTRCVDRLHDSGKDEGADKGDAERIGHGAVVLVEGVFVDVEPESLVEVAEEEPPYEVALSDDDGVLLVQLTEVGEGRSEHGVRRGISPPRRLIELFEARLDGGDVAEDTVLGQKGDDLAENGYGVLERDGVDDKLWGEGLDLSEFCEALTVVCEAHASGVALEHGHLMVEAEQVDEEASHLACSQYQNLHSSYLLMISICWRTDSS